MSVNKNRRNRYTFTAQGLPQPITQKTQLRPYRAYHGHKLRYCLSGNLEQ